MGPDAERRAVARALVGDRRQRSRPPLRPVPHPRSRGEAGGVADRRADTRPVLDPLDLVRRTQIRETGGARLYVLARLGDAGLRGPAQIAPRARSAVRVRHHRRRRSDRRRARRARARLAALGTLSRSAGEGKSLYRAANCVLPKVNSRSASVIGFWPGPSDNTARPRCTAGRAAISEYQRFTPE